MNINQTAEVMSAGPLAVATPELCQPILILHASFKQLTPVILPQHKRDRIQGCRSLSEGCNNLNHQKKDEK